MKTKQIISVFLAMLMVLQPITIFAGNYSQDASFNHTFNYYDLPSRDFNIIHEVVSVEDIITEQIAEIDGFIYNFIVTEEFVYSSRLTPEGHYSFAFRYINSDTAYSGEIDFSEESTAGLQVYSDMSAPVNMVSASVDILNNSSLLSSFVLDNLEELATEAKDFETIYIEDGEIVEFTEHMISPRGEASVNNVINRLAANRHIVANANFNGRNIGGMECVQNGVRATVTLFHAHTLTQQHITSRFFAARTSELIVSLFFIIPVTTLRSVVSLAWDVHNGIWATIVSMNAERWEIVSRETKTAVIQGNTRHWAGRTAIFETYRGNLGFNVPANGNISMHWDFNDNMRLMNTALDNFFGWW